MRKLSWLLSLLLILGLAFGLVVSSCAGGGDDDDDDDDTTDDDADDDTDDDLDPGDFDVWLDEFTPQMTVVIKFGGQLQAEGDIIKQQLPPVMDSLSFAGASLLATGEYQIDFDYQSGGGEVPDPFALYIIGLTADMSYDSAYFSYAGTITVDSTGDVGDLFAGYASQLQMIEAELTFNPDNTISISILPDGRKAYIGFAYLACPIANYPPGMGDICM